MKNIKTYEKFFTKSKYNNGDYILVNYYDKIYHGKITNNKITSFFYTTYIFELGEIRWIHNDDIERLLSREEIEKIELESNLKKYNL